MVGADIEAAAIAAALGRSPAVRRPCAGGAIADAALGLGLEGAVVGVVSVAAAGLAALLGGKAVERPP